MRKFPALMFALTVVSALVGCSPSGGSGRLVDGDTCVEYTYPNVPAPTATTVVGVTVWPCPIPTPTTTQPPVTTTTTTVAPTTTTTVPPTTTTTPPTVEYPNPSNTGARNVTLTVHNGDYYAPAGVVVDGKRITGKLIVGSGGATIRNSEVYGGITNYPSRGRFTVTDSTIGAPSGCNGGIGIAYENYTAERVHVRSVGDAFRGGQSASGVSDIFIRDSYVRGCAGTGFHADGYQGFGAGSGVTLTHNTIDYSGVDFRYTTAAVFNADGSTAMVAENNLVAGGGWPLTIWDASGRSVVKGNKIIQGSWEYGPMRGSCSDLWTDNRVVRIDDAYRVISDVGPATCTR